VPRFLSVSRFSQGPPRGQVWFALVCHLFVVLPLPVPSAALPVTAKATLHNANERYPCEGCGCGCTSAEHCWNHCCCTTAAERLAWAHANGVAVPPSLSNARHDKDSLDADDISIDRDRDNNHRDTVRSEQRTRWVLGFRAQRCQGQAGTLIAAGTLFWPPRPTIVAADLLRTPAVDSAAPLYSSVFFSPAEPPPRDFSSHA